MAIITTETNDILISERGEDVRDSIISACEKIAGGTVPDVGVEEAGYYLTVSSSGEWEALEWT